MFKKYKFLIVFFLILSLGFFLRAFKFGDWMHYQLDQARDFRVIHSAVKYGVGELPLQGPKAAGNVEIKSETGKYDDTTTLRLGPLFYYLEFVSALIFGDTPAGSIALILIFSFLTIPLFYCFSREFFDRKISLILITIFSFSVYFVTYSRFGWNPNLMPFFMLLSMFCLLQMIKKDEEKVNGLEDFLPFFNFVKKVYFNFLNFFYKLKKDSRFHGNDKFDGRGLSFASPYYNKGWWLILLSISMAFLTNMHFLAFTVAPTVVVIYLVLVRPKISFKFWIGAILVFVFLNTPLIINDIKTGGENSKAFISALMNKSGNSVEEEEENNSKNKEKHSFLEKFSLNAKEHNRYFWLILTGDQNAEIPQFINKENSISKNKKTISCYGNLFCRSNVDRKELLRGIFSLVLILLSIFAFIYFYWKEKRRRYFLNLCAIWLGVNFFAYIPLAYSLAPRFFLLSSPLALILFGMILKMITEFNFKNLKWRKIFTILIWLISGIFIISNLYFVYRYFNELSQANSNPNLSIKTDYILKEKNRMTLQQMEEIVDFMEQKHKENNFPIFLDGQSEFKRAFWERIDFRGINRDPIPKDLKPLYREGNYFVILRTQSDSDDYLKNFLKGMILVEKKTFGTLMIFHLKPKEEFITDERKIFPLEEERKDPAFSSSAQVRYLWRQVLE